MMQLSGSSGQAGTGRARRWVKPAARVNAAVARARLVFSSRAPVAAPVRIATKAAARWPWWRHERRPRGAGDPEAEEDHVAGLHRREDLAEAEEVDGVD